MKFEYLKIIIFIRLIWPAMHPRCLVHYNCNGLSATVGALQVTFQTLHCLEGTTTLIYFPSLILKLKLMADSI